MEETDNTESEKSCNELLAFIFSDYPSLVKHIAPEGWDKSLFKKFHNPTAEQQFEEYKRITDNLARLSKKEAGHYDKTLVDIQNEYLDEKSKDPDECIDVLGNAVYDIFSNNHEVISSVGSAYDLGSMRGSGGFIADFLNDFFKELNFNYDYIDFYMGSTFMRNRADMTPFYEFVFKKLKEKDCTWKYSFPRLYIMDFRHLKKEQTPEEYDPQQAVLKEIEEKKDTERLEKIRQEMEEEYQKELEEAKLNPPPIQVQAFVNVFGHLPEGFPH
jgi:hypothetical protein